jgi:hypothetical protein
MARKRAKVVRISMLLAIFVLPIVGQRVATAPADGSDLRIVSSFVGPGEPVPEECHEEAHNFAQSLVRYPRPLLWHWILVCDDAGWQRFLRLSGRAEGVEIYASTDLLGRTSYVRGSKLLNPCELQVNPDVILAHELAHIWLKTADETRVRDLVRSWQRAVEMEPNRPKRSFKSGAANFEVSHELC